VQARHESSRATSDDDQILSFNIPQWVLLYFTDQVKSSVVQRIACHLGYH